MRRSLLAIATAIVLLSLVPLVPAQAVAAPAIKCGDTIRANAVLVSDLTCQTNGLTLLPGVQLDLHHYTLRGPRNGTGTGITASVGPNIVVRNGTITGWGTGIGAPTEESGLPNGADVSAVSFTNNTAAMSGWFSTFTVRASRFTGNGTGAGGFSTQLTVQDSTFLDNRGEAVGGNDRGISIRNSTFKRNGSAVVCSEANLEIANSTLSANKRGIWTFNCEGARLTGNTFTGNGTAYDTSFGGGSGVDQIDHNTFAHNAVAITTVYSTHLNGNVFTGNETALTAQDSGLKESIAMQANVFTGNGNAVYLLVKSRIQSTVAVNNSGYGIYAPGATDLGGNIAFGNGRQPQCTGVVCTAR